MVPDKMQIKKSGFVTGFVALCLALSFVLLSMSTAGFATTANANTNTNTKTSKKLFVYPAGGSTIVSSEFMSPSRPTHNGLDIMGGDGKIYAANAGVVTEIRTGCEHDSPSLSCECNGGCGNCITIRHSDGYVTKYLHLKEKILVHVGQHVQMGQRIATMGSTGRSSAVHLHFSVLNPQGGYIHPLDYIGKQYGPLPPNNVHLRLNRKVLTTNQSIVASFCADDTKAFSLQFLDKHGNVKKSVNFHNQEKTDTANGFAVLSFTHKGFYKLRVVAHNQTGSMKSMTHEVYVAGKVAGLLSSDNLFRLKKKAEIERMNKSVNQLIAFDKQQDYRVIELPVKSMAGANVRGNPAPNTVTGKEKLYKNDKGEWVRRIVLSLDEYNSFKNLSMPIRTEDNAEEGADFALDGAIVATRLQYGYEINRFASSISGNRAATPNKNVPAEKKQGAGIIQTESSQDENTQDADIKQNAEGSVVAHSRITNRSASMSGRRHSVVYKGNRYYYSLMENRHGVMLLGCASLDGKVQIPSSIGGKTVKAISAGAFENNEKITQVNIPAKIEYVGNNAFAGCFNLKKVTFNGRYAPYVVKNSATFSTAKICVPEGSFGYYALAMSGYRVVNSEAKGRRS